MSVLTHGWVLCYCMLGLSYWMVKILDFAFLADENLPHKYLFVIVCYCFPAGAMIHKHLNAFISYI